MLWQQASTVPDPHPSWIYPKEDLSWKQTIMKEFNIHPVSAQVMVSRGLSTLDEVHDYLYAKLPDLHDPFTLEQMQTATDRLCKAIENKETVLIYGDNDVDGMTGTTLLTEFLRLLGCPALFYVCRPGISRDELIVESLDYAKENNCSLLITVDCGITAADEIAKIVAAGIEVIITDHHEIAEVLPKCTAILNPKLPGNNYPNRDLTGVGVAFKLAHAITNQLVSEEKIGPKKIDLKRHLDLVALGTISDMGALRGENRILVHYGLRQVRKGKRIGLAKLLSVADVDPSEITTFGVASKIAPRLNSLGRISDPQKGVELLLVRNSNTAEKMAAELDLNNIERQKIERTMSSDVEHKIVTDPEILKNKAVVMYSDTWHPGVIAILATRISKQYNRPTVMLAIEGDIAKGSLRSIREFPLLSILKEKCSDLLLNFGGHDFAAGLTLRREHVEEFKKRFLAAADKGLSEQDVVNKLYLDGKINFEDLTFDLMESLDLLEPYGSENPQPILYCEAKQAWPPKVVGKTHLKLYLEQGDRMLEGIAFGKANLSSQLRRKDITLEIAFTPQVNNFQGPSIQLLIRDFKIKE